MCLYMDSDCYCVIKEDTCDTTYDKCKLNINAEDWKRGIDSFLKNNKEILLKVGDPT